MNLDHEFSAALAHNRRAWDERARNQARFTRPAGDKEFAFDGDPLKSLDPVGWLGGDVRGKRMLCLAAGGGKHALLYAAAGAVVTVVDISPAMLELDRQVAAERRLAIRTVEASMDDLPMFETGEFELVIQPVSTCYVPDVRKVYREVARVIRPGGIYISQHKQPASLQAATQPSPRGYELIEPYYRSGPLPPVVGTLVREDGTLEFLHRWEELLGEMCRAGFAIEDLLEPPHADLRAEIGTFAHRSRYVAPYVRLKARRNSASAPPRVVTLWQPG